MALNRVSGAGRDTRWYRWPGPLTPQLGFRGNKQRNGYEAPLPDRGTKESQAPLWLGAVSSTKISGACKAWGTDSISLRIRVGSLGPRKGGLKLRGSRWMRGHVPKVVSEKVPEVDARWFLPARRSFMLILFIFLYIWKYDKKDCKMKMRFTNHVTCTHSWNLICVDKMIRLHEMTWRWWLDATVHTVQCIWRITELSC
jgi:hypothetical protein